MDNESAYSAFKNYIGERITLTQAEWELVQNSFSVLTLPKGFLLLEEGKICNHLYFLHSGLLRFFYWNDGEDITKFFTFGSQVFTSQQSFSFRQPAKENIETIEETELLSISFETLQVLYEKIPSWSKLTRIIVQEVQQFTEDLMIEFQTQTAEQRYVALLEREPSLVSRIPIKLLASYLGIAPESLSRIRKKITATNKLT